jgi:AGZA family xanthine/uracil permease-like MFS transporter
MIERLFKLSENKTNVRTEVLAGVTTFLTMAYIVFVQPAVLSGKMFGADTGMDFGAVTTATCLSAALATAIMAIYAGYNVSKIEWNDYTESIPAFLIIIGIPLSYSIADGLALGFISYAVIKAGSRRGREISWLTYALALVLVLYFVFVRSRMV